MKALRRVSTSSASPSSPTAAAAAAAVVASSPSSSSSSSSAWIHLRSLLIIASSSSSSASSPSVSSPLAERGGLKSPWSRRKRRRALSHRQWSKQFSANGRLRDGGAKFLKRVRSGGVDPRIRSEVWPFLLGVYELNSSESERNIVKAKKRKEYEKLRRQCEQLSTYHGDSNKASLKSVNEIPETEEIVSPNPGIEFPFEDLKQAESTEEENRNRMSCGEVESNSSDSESSDEEYSENIPFPFEDQEPKFTRTTSVRDSFSSSSRTTEDFATWQRIIRLDALRTLPLPSPLLPATSLSQSLLSAASAGLADFDHLPPSMVDHASRLVKILEAYAVFDAEIGYCQGMSDLLSPVVAVVRDDWEAFWCFVGFMRKARRNFRLDEAGIRWQLKVVSRIIQCKDSHLYKHLEKLQAEDCFFVYRMVVVLFRRELTFEQTICLWEVMWADQAAIRARFGLSAWARIRLRAPPTEDLLLYAIAACVLQRRKLIIEKYSCMDEILRECNGMMGSLDVWRLLDDAHDLVVDLHDKIRSDG
ncbi:hypothetical protein LUZ60_011835 [Juncus effusus]|nr:hypothetical protein LUZ60_011835 [Juncus effusus]